MLHMRKIARQLAKLEEIGVTSEQEGAYQTLSRLSDLLQVLDTPETEPE